MKTYAINKFVWRIAALAFLIGLLMLVSSCGTRNREKSRQQEKTKTELREQIERETSQQKETLEESTKITNEQIQSIADNIDFESIDQDKDFELSIGIDSTGTLNIKGRNVRGSKSNSLIKTNKNDTTTSIKKKVWNAEASEAIDLNLNQQNVTDKLEVKVDSDKGNWISSLSWFLFWISVLVILVGYAYHKRTSIITKLKSLLKSIF